MELTLKSWSHPKTGETRLYINSPAVRSGHKCFVRRDDHPELDWELVWQAPRGESRDEMAIGRIADELAAMAGVDGFADLTFEMIEKLAK